jgi:hypothetical protein
MRAVHLFALLALLGSTRVAHSQVVMKELWAVNGPVRALAKDANNLYIGGDFTSVGKDIPNGTAVDVTTAVASSGFAKPNGTVVQAIPDGNGGWFIRGSFTRVGSQNRRYLARINADGSLHAFNVTHSADINDIFLDGNVLYLAGTFTSINGQFRTRLAAVDATTGTLTSWSPVVNGNGHAIAKRGNTVYVGGSYTTAGGQPRSGLAAFDATTAAVTSWNPAPDAYVQKIFLHGNSIYVAGDFAYIGGQSRYRIAEFNATTGLVTGFAPDPNFYTTVNTVVNAVGGPVYVGGNFTSIGGAGRKYVAALDSVTGVATSWDPQVNDAVYALHVDGSNVYMAGNFTTVGGQSRNRAASVDAATAAPNAWDPGVMKMLTGQQFVGTLSRVGDNFYLGGSYTAINSETRNYLAALDLNTGVATSWAPTVGGSVRSLVRDGSTLYAGGYFGITSFDLPSGAANWSNALPVGSYIGTIALGNGNLYVGGGFGTMGGQPRTYLAAMDAATGAVTSWNPGANSNVNTVFFHNNLVYVGGAFTTIAGQSRTYLAALDAATGTATSWNPQPNGWIHSIAASGSDVYAGGRFSLIGGVARNRLAKLNNTNGAALPLWNPNVNNTVNTVVLRDGLLFFGGEFVTVGGVTRNYYAAVNASSGALTGHNINANNFVHAILPDTYITFAGGEFTSYWGQSRSYLGAQVTTWPLPVELTQFTVKAKAAGALWNVASNWTTASEQNSSHFIVERSAGLSGFTEIGRVAAAGQSASVLNYSFTDPSPLSGTSYYRLKQVDLDGKFTYSPIRSVTITRTGLVVNVFPNPVKDAAEVAISSPKTQEVSYVLRDQNSKVVRKGNFRLEAGTNVFRLDLGQVAAGVYLLSVSGDFTTAPVRILKQ